MLFLNFLTLKMIKVILKEDLTGQGKKNDIIEVSNGFARNFLFPKNKAVVATSDALAKIEAEKQKSESEEKKTKENNLQLKEKISALAIEIGKKSKDDKLFGSVSAKEIAAALSQKGVTVEPKKIIIETPIKSTGEHKVSVELDKDTRAILKIRIVEGK